MTSMIKVDEIQNSAGTTTLAKFENGQLTGALSPATGFKNRLINGDMRIDQRNNGASVTAGSGYVVDRWLYDLDTQNSGSGTTSKQQSSVAPAGFSNSLLTSITTAGTVTAAHRNRLQQRIEGFNVSDLGWGTASASSATLSFLVRSSLTGTFAGALTNYAGRSYPFTYTVAVANTWEQKTVVIAGDTTGTWNSSNGIGIGVILDLGSGSNYNGTAGAWAAGEFFRTSGSVNLVANAGATFYITGVQLEKGTVATPFEFRSIGQELALCQRYYQMLINSQLRMYVENVVRDPRTISPEMRATPTLTKTFPSGVTNLNSDSSAGMSPRSWVIDLQIVGFGLGVIDTANYTVIASAEL